MSDDPRRWRQLTVWLHVLTSVGWMSLALVLEVALLIGWLVGHVGLAFRIGVILHLLGWLWVLRCDRRHRD